MEKKRTYRRQKKKEQNLLHVYITEYTNDELLHEIQLVVLITMNTW